jgi:uncharacterized membrane protein
MNLFSGLHAALNSTHNIYKPLRHPSFMDVVWKLILISLLPWIELRGSIPIGIGMGLEPLYVFAVCTVTDILLVPALIGFYRYFMPCILKIERLNRFYQWHVVRTLKRYDRYKKWELVGLALFVGVPLPFTGVYSGTLVSFVLDLKVKEAFISVGSGAVIAGVVVTAVSVGILG